jgi:hypothetical protein
MAKSIRQIKVQRQRILSKLMSPGWRIDVPVNVHLPVESDKGLGGVLKYCSPCSRDRRFAKATKS